MNINNEIDFLIITALEEELEAVNRIFKKYNKPKPYHLSGDIFDTIFFKIGDYKIAALCIGNKGRVPAACVTLDAIRLYSPQIVLLVGIAGGIKGKVKIGDVIIPEIIYDYEVKKLVGKKDEQFGDEQSGDEQSGEKIEEIIEVRMHRSFGALFNHARRESLTGFEKYIEEALDDKAKNKLVRILEDSEKSDVSGNESTEADSLIQKMKKKQPLIYRKKWVYSGDKSISADSLIQKIIDELPHIIGIEMEGGGVSEAVMRGGIEQSNLLMIKAVSDYADSAEKFLITELWRDYVCLAAAAATRKLIEVIATKKPIAPCKINPLWPINNLINTGKIRDAIEFGNVLVFLCDYSTYADLAITISMGPTNFVLWTLDGSPLVVLEENLVRENKTLTEHDYQFSILPNTDKLRIVIFSSRDEIKNYTNARGKTLERRRSFEKSCVSPSRISLYFTCRGLLKMQSDFSEDFPEDFHYDFGFVARPGSKKEKCFGYCFNSPFSNKAEKASMSHVSFFAPDKIDSLLTTVDMIDKYNIILKSVPYYPKMITKFRLIRESNVDGNLLFKEAKKLNKICSSCTICP